MTIVAARALANRSTCFVGIGLPSTAANLALRLHAPELVLIYESGTIGSRPTVLPLSVGDGELAETAITVVPMREIFSYWLEAGRIDIGFLGAAQIDRHGNLNTTVIGDYVQPTVRLPGAGGAPEIGAWAREVFVVLRHDRRSFVAELDFLTTSGERVSRVITDLGVLEREYCRREQSGDTQSGVRPSGELVVTGLYPGVTIEQMQAATGWELQSALTVARLDPPTDVELSTLRDLTSRTEVVHARHGSR